MNSNYFIILHLSLLSNIILYSMNTEMAIMMGSQQGAMIAMQENNKEFQELSQSISTNQQTLNNTTNLFVSDVQAAHKKQIQKAKNIFNQAQKHIASTQSEQNEYSKEMQTYIFQAVSIQKPPQYYMLGEAIKLDELFSLGTMYTPKGTIWKNPFGIGNWEYDHTNDSFWQLHNDSLINSKNNSSENAMQNSIFTEYFTVKDSYHIQCELTLHQVRYPFCAGIMFNKARWVSGNQDSITKCRLIGIYGTNASNVEACFTEQYTQQTKTNDQTKTTTLYPLQQIIKGKSLSKKTIDKKYINNLTTNPTTFVIKIITSPQEIQFKVWPKKTKEPADYITVKSNNPGLYQYHDIGFISPGAITQCKLVQPYNLLFSQNAIKVYAQDIQQLLTA